MIEKKNKKKNEKKQKTKNRKKTARYAFYIS